MHINSLKVNYDALKNCTIDEYIAKIKELRLEIHNEFE